MEPNLFTAPYQPHSPTSRAAAEGIAPKLNELEMQVLYILRYAKDGRTDEAGWSELNGCIAIHAELTKRDKRVVKESTYRARRVRLVELGLVKDSGKTRPTASGRSATVWVATGE